MKTILLLAVLGLFAQKASCGYADAEVEEIRKEFQELDGDGDGTLTPDELLAVQDEKMKEYEGFLKGIKVQTVKSKKLLPIELINAFDLNGDGTIYYNEIYQYFKESIPQIVDDADTNGDGGLSWEEFLSYEQE